VLSPGVSVLASAAASGCWAGGPRRRPAGVVVAATASLTERLTGALTERANDQSRQPPCCCPGRTTGARGRRRSEPPSRPSVCSGLVSVERYVRRLLRVYGTKASQKGTLLQVMAPARTTTRSSQIATSPNCLPCQGPHASPVLLTPYHYNGITGKKIACDMADSKAGTALLSIAFIPKLLKLL
jgi:hypothetical protein